MNNRLLFDQKLLYYFDKVFDARYRVYKDTEFKRVFKFLLKKKTFKFCIDNKHRFDKGKGEYFPYFATLINSFIINNGIMKMKSEVKQHIRNNKINTILK